MRLTAIVLLVLSNYINAQDISFLTNITDVINFKPDMIINLLWCKSECNKNYCKVIKICRPVNRTSKLHKMDVYFHPHIKLEAPMLIQFNMYKLFGTVYRPFMIKLEDELCTFLSRRDHPTFKLPEDNWSHPRWGNLWYPCPLYGHRYVHFGITNSHYVPIPLIPVGDWKIEYIISRKMNRSNDLIITWSEYYEVKPTSAMEF